MDSVPTIKITLQERVHQLISITFRSPELRYDNYRMVIDTSAGSSKVSNPTRKTIVPKFNINRRNISIFNYLQHTKDSSFKLKLRDSADKEVLEFEIVIDQLCRLKKDITVESMFYYPSVILEYSHGFFTTPFIYEKNEEIRNLIYPPINDPKSAKKVKNQQIQPNSNNANERKISGETGSNENVNTEDEKIDTKTNTEKPPTTPSKKIKIKPPINATSGFTPTDGNSEYPINPNNNANNAEPENVVEFGKYFLVLSQISSIKENTNYSDRSQEEENKAHIEKIQNMQFNIDIFGKQYHIKKMTEQKNLIEGQNMLLESIIGGIKELIHNKIQHLHTFKDDLKIKEKENKNDVPKKDYKKEYVKYNIISEAIFNKKIIETCYIFFQRDYQNLFALPRLGTTAAERYKQYSDSPKSFATYLGSTAMLFNYLSKIFGFSLRFPLFVSGSKSYCASKKKDGFNPLYPDPKYENKHQVFEIGLEYQKHNLKEILNFLSLHPDLFYPTKKFDYDSCFCECFHRQNFFQIFERFNNMLGQYVMRFYEMNDEFGI